MSEREHQSLAVEYNNSIVPYLAGKTIVELFETQARRTPNQIALVFEQQRLTYCELNHRANQLAHHLTVLGVGPDVLVGAFVERSLEMIVGLLGILKAGAAYMPMDTTFPPERIAFMLGDANVTVLLTQTNFLARLPTSAVQAVCLDSFDWTRCDEPGNRDARVRPESLAYVIYTSGSTGRPKGVCIEHRNIVNYAFGVVEQLQFRPGMNHATVSTIASDLGNTVIFPALVTGGCLHVISQERAENQAMLSDYFKRENIDVLKIVPSHLAALQTGNNPEQLMPRSRLILGGEASRLDWIERLRLLSPNCEIYNHYGPTETTVGVLTYHVSSQLPITLSGTLPLGKPLPNSRVYILDEQGQPVAAGAAGELYIGGRGVARGYLNRTDLTAEKFILDPFSPEPGGRLYRTGDRARYLPDGNIEFCGRIDHQVKIRGYRVELGEIEGALCEHQGVRDAVASARDDQAGNNELVAYVVPQRSAQSLWESKALDVLPDGSPVAHLNKNETAYIYNEIFVLQAYLRHGITIHDGDCVVDAGANIGLFTVFASRLARNLRIISFEPNPAAYACLKANADALGTDVKCFSFGLSRENRSAHITCFEGFSLLSGFYADEVTEREVVTTYALNRESESGSTEPLAAEIGQLLEDRFHAKTESAQLRTLSSVIAEQGIERIDLLKINVEKSELDVLLGISAADWVKIRQLVIEVDLKVSLEPITTLLEQEGYEVLVEQDPLLRKTELCYVYAIRPSAANRLLREQPAEGHLRSLQPVNEEVLTPTILRKFLKERLPQYMIPSMFVLMEKFPLTVNGKIDRKALPTPAYDNVQPVDDFVRPPTETEKALGTIWAEVLKIKNIGINDDFFDLGGHSLQAIRVASRIQDVFGVKISFPTLFNNPTIAALANVLTVADEYQCLVRMRPGSSERPPFFCVHGAGGNVQNMRALAMALPADLPFYCFQDKGLDGSEPFESIEETARCYVDEIRRVQPHGPYYIGGTCYGGMVAFEMARRLEELGEPVAVLVLIDSFNLAFVRSLSKRERFFRTVGSPIWRVAWHARRILSQGEWPSHISGPFRALRRRLRNVAELPATNGADYEVAAGTRLGENLKRVMQANIISQNQFVPKPYSGSALIFRASANKLNPYDDYHLGWGSVVRGGIECFEIEGHHMSILEEPAVRLMAEKLDAKLMELSFGNRSDPAVIRARPDAHADTVL